MENDGFPCAVLWLAVPVEIGKQPVHASESFLPIRYARYRKNNSGRGNKVRYNSVRTRLAIYASIGIGNFTFQNRT